MDRVFGTFFDEHYEQIDVFIDEYILELFVWIPWVIAHV